MNIALINDWDYFIADAFKQMKKSGIFNFLEHTDKSEISSWDASLKVLNIFKEWVEYNKGWDEILSTATQKREKSVQKMLQLSGKYFCQENNIDMSFEANYLPTRTICTDMKSRLKIMQKQKELLSGYSYMCK